MNSSIVSVAIVALLIGCALGGPVGAPVGPVNVQDNNIGDIVNVGVNIQADIKTEIDSTIVNVLVALLTHIDELNLGSGGAQGEHHPGQVAAPMQNGDLLKALGNLKALGQMGEQPNKEQLEKMLSEKAEQFIQQLLKKN